MLYLKNTKQLGPKCMCLELILTTFVKFRETRNQILTLLLLKNGKIQYKGRNQIQFHRQGKFLDI